MSRILRLLCCSTTLLFAAGSTSGTVHADGKSFTLVSLDTTADVRADGSMAVTEMVTYDFSGGPFTVGIRSFERNLNDVTSFAAADSDGPLAVTSPSNSISGQWEWALRGPVTDQQSTFTVTYLVRNVVVFGSDVADLNWQFIGTEHPLIGRMSIAVELPGTADAALPTTLDTDTSVVRAFAHGPANGSLSVHLLGIVARVTDVPQGMPVELRVVAPIRLFQTIGQTTLLPRVLAQERELLLAPKRATDRHDLGYLLAPVLSLTAVFGTGLLWMVRGREKKSREVLGEYWREPLDERPAIALTNMHRGAVPLGAAFAGTVVDLAQRGYLQIVGEPRERVGPDTTVHHYQWLGKPAAPDVLRYEHQVLDFIFRGQSEATSDGMHDWAKSNAAAAKGELDAISRDIKSEYAKFGYEVKGNGAELGVLWGCCFAVGIASFALKLYTNNGVAWIGVGVAVFMVLTGSRLLMNRSQKGVEAAAKAEGLKRYITDFSRLEDAPIGHLILWERYLVYAVAFGVSAELLNGLALRAPAVVNDPAFGLWYVGSAGRFDGFDRMESYGTDLVSTSNPKSSNSSGSGGGFSSGGFSGGGGGGGFGAR